VVRRLYPFVFFGKPPDEDVKQSVEKALPKGLRALKSRAKFAPYIAGPELTLADCAAFVHLPLVSLSTKLAYGRDFLDDLPIKKYIKELEARPAFKRVNEDRKAAQAAMAKQ
jgi:glutathione S-transferase